MKSTQIMKIVTSLSTVALLSLSAGAMAQAETDRAPRADRLVEQLELTEAQRDQLLALREEQRAEAEAIAAERREATQADREAMRATVEERQAAQQARVAEILTPEQLTQLEEMRAAAQEQREDRMAGAVLTRQMGPRGNGAMGPRGNGGSRNQRGDMQGPRPGNR